MGILDTLTVGRRALNAASAGIEVTSQNVANANTVGYSRRRLLAQNADPIQRRGQWLGTGVQVTAYSRATDRLLGSRLVTTAGTEAQAAERERILATAEGYFDEQTATGLNESLASFYDALSSLTADPSNTAMRREVVTMASRLADNTSRIATSVTEAIIDVEEAVDDRVVEINTLFSQIATLNRQIGRAGASLGPGDLLDRRDQLVREVGELSGARVDFAADGQATVFIGGHAVVSGPEARTLSAAVDAAGVTQIYVSAGTGLVRVTGELGGELGGSIQARDAMQGWLDDLDTFADTLATTVNAQHALGFDSAGNPGGDIFVFNATAPAASLAVDTLIVDDPALLAVAGAATAVPGDADNVIALLDLEDTAFIGGLTGSDFLSSLMSLVGTDTSSASADADTLSAQLQDLDAMRGALSGVDTDEEAIKLIEFQTAYRAASRVLSAGDELLQTLLAIGG